MKLYGFERLDVWQKSRLLICKIYALSKNFPDDERYGLTNQVRRAGISIACNIAEGTGRITGKDQARFTEIAYSSLLEVLNLLMLASDLEYVGLKDIENIRPLIDEISNKLSALRSAQLNKK